jgi:photosystem II stability/assembly factor-like uncharacterized protein
MRQLCFFIVFTVTWQAALAQPASADEILNSIEHRRKLAQTSILKNYPVRAIGPVAPGGRVVDIDVNPRNSKEFYVALASGGLFKTTNNGITFKPVFDDIASMSIGDIAVCPANPDIVFVGTGEKNSSRSSYAGSGVYKTIDGGKTWKNAGLNGTHRISRIVFHPTDPNTCWVAAIGSLFSHSPERGLYKSADGGKTWRKTLFINDSTGVIDVVVHPKDPSVLLAATWERTRRMGNFAASGQSSSIYRSDDGGETWVKSGTGFAQGTHVGRIGLAVGRSAPEIVYALLDNQSEVPDQRKSRKFSAEKELLSRMKDMSREALLNSDDAFLEHIFNKLNVQHRYTAGAVKRDIREGKYLPKTLARYLEDFHSASSRILGAEVYRSDDFGATWTKRNEYDLDGVFHSYGYYFGEIAVSPADPDMVYLQGVPLLKSINGGRTWHRLDTIKTPREVHVDHHAMWINPDDPAHMLLGNDGGLYQSYDGGATWLHLNSIPAAQFYTVNVDMEKPYNVYGGVQDNGVWKGSSDGNYWKQLFSGDGMFVIPDPRNPATVFTGYNFGNYFRMEMDKKKSVKISPLHNVNEPVLRWNWRAPLLMSKHSGDLYIAANRIFTSSDRGESWTGISADLTLNRKQGNVPASTISALAESPVQRGLLYAGTDEGNVWVTSDNGTNWTPISKGLPEGKYVSSICASPHDASVVAVTLNGFRTDDFRTYLFISTDKGKTWTSLKGNLPESGANVILIDPVNPDLLYCGVDNGAYVTLDRGKNWHLFNGMLSVPAYDMVIHPRENELVVATHGRGLFIADVKPLQAVRRKVLSATDPLPVRHSDMWGEQKYNWEKVEVPKHLMLLYSGKAGKARMEVTDISGKMVFTKVFTVSAGFNVVPWDLRLNEPADGFIGKGDYKIKYQLEKYSDTVTLVVR